MFAEHSRTSGNHYKKVVKLPLTEMEKYEITIQKIKLVSKQITSVALSSLKLERDNFISIRVGR